MASQHKLLEQKVSETLVLTKQTKALQEAMFRARDVRRKLVDSFPDGDAFRDEVSRIKQRCLNNQPELVQRFIQKAQERGSHVYVAKDAAAAIGYIQGICSKRNATHVTKSKTITAEEIGLNEALEAAGLDVRETDLGELIIQLLKEKPIHTLAPAIHKTAQEVAALLTQATGEMVSDDINVIMDAVRKLLHPSFINADVGISGGNVGVAESGVVAIMTNEGNEQQVSAIPDTHIFLLGIDKIVETLDEMTTVVNSIAISLMGQRISTYVSVLGGRAPAKNGAAREEHIVLLDNGRSVMRSDPVLAESLKCVRCTACLNVCPTFGSIGGHVFGHVYAGPIGIPWTAGIHGLEHAGAFSELCVSCGLCKTVCPAKIDIPMLIAEVKQRNAECHAHAQANKTMMAAEQMSKLGSLTAPFSTWALGNPIFRWVMEKTLGVDRKRRMPPFNRVPLHKRFARTAPSSPAKNGRRVLYFADLYADYNAPELGEKVVAVLNDIGCDVVVPKDCFSGYPHFAYGDVEQARRKAQTNVQRLCKYVEDGYEIVSTEPTTTHCLKHLYPLLLGHSEASLQVADHSHGLFEYLLLLDGDSQLTKAKPLSGRRVGFHISCHQRPLDLNRSSVAWLKKLGAEVVVIENGTCCGMGGTFGMKAGALGRELSDVIGAPLFDEFKKGNIEAIITESSVCKMHLSDGAGLPVHHPLEFAFRAQ